MTKQRTFRFDEKLLSAVDAARNARTTWSGPRDTKPNRGGAVTSERAAAKRRSLRRNANVAL